MIRIALHALLAVLLPVSVVCNVIDFDGLGRYWLAINAVTAVIWALSLRRDWPDLAATVRGRRA